MRYEISMSSTKPFPDMCQQALVHHMRPDLFKALCNPKRISIVITLATKLEAQTVSDLTECCDIDFSGVSRHLKTLRDAGIVFAEKNGQNMLYSLKSEDLAETLHAMADTLIACRDII